MIWLKKVRKNALPDKNFNIVVYLQKMLEPFDKYLASIKETELTPEIIQDAQFHKSVPMLIIILKNRPFCL